eukprot:2542909-Amphidinium_carterae.1
MLPQRQSTNTRSGRYPVHPLPQGRPRQREMKRTMVRLATDDRGENSAEHPPSTLEARTAHGSNRECVSKSPNHKKQTLQDRPQGPQTTGKKAGPTGNGSNGKQGRPLHHLHSRLGVQGRPEPNATARTAEEAHRPGRGPAAQAALSLPR